MLQGNSNCIMNDSNKGNEKPIDSTARAKFLEEHPSLKSRLKPNHSIFRFIPRYWAGSVDENKVRA